MAVFRVTVNRGPGTVKGLRRLDIVVNTFSCFPALGFYLGLERTDFIEGRGKGEEGRGAGFWHF